MATRRRSTQQRAVIETALAELNTFVSAQEFHAILRDKGTAVGIATIYRGLQDLVATGNADSLRNESGEVLYRHCAQAKHHHHLICRNCGRAEEILAAGVERWAQAAAEKFGFVEVDHQVELFGLCAVCAALPASSR